MSKVQIGSILEVQSKTKLIRLIQNVDGYTLDSARQLIGQAEEQSQGFIILKDYTEHKTDEFVEELIALGVCILGVYYNKILDTENLDQIYQYIYDHLEDYSLHYDRHKYKNCDDVPNSEFSIIHQNSVIILIEDAQIQEYLVGKLIKKGIKCIGEMLGNDY